jgi:hypothetical protein
MGNENEPSNQQPSSNGNGDKEDSKPAGIKEWITRLCVGGNVGVQGINIVLDVTKSWQGMTTTRIVGRSCTYASSGIAIVNSPVIVQRERQLTKEDTFRKALNGVREQAGLLSTQNDILGAEIDELQSDVDRMKEVEQALNELASTQGTQLTELMDLIEENKKINREMRVVLENKILQDVISLVLDIDADGSFKIENKEIDRLIVGITLIEGVCKFDTQLFRKEVANCEGKVELVIALIKDMISGNGGGKNGTKCCIEIEDTESFMRKRSSGESCS